MNIWPTIDVKCCRLKLSNKIIDGGSVWAVTGFSE